MLKKWLLKQFHKLATKLGYIKITPTTAIPPPTITHSKYEIYKLWSKGEYTERMVLYDNAHKDIFLKNLVSELYKKLDPYLSLEVYDDPMTMRKVYTLKLLVAREKK